MLSKNNTNVMIDIETLSCKSNAVILTIGAVKFNFQEKSITDEFYKRIDIQSCLDKGLHKDINTINWWKNQNIASRREAFNIDGRVPLEVALSEFKAFLGDKKKLIVWSHGPSFDIVILENAFQNCGIEIPWMYKNVRDTRTIYDLGNLDYNALGEATHHAIEDCKRQINGLFSVLPLSND